MFKESQLLVHLYSSDLQTVSVHVCAHTTNHMVCATAMWLSAYCCCAVQPSAPHFNKIGGSSPWQWAHHCLLIWVLVCFVCNLILHTHCPASFTSCFRQCNILCVMLLNYLFRLLYADYHWDCIFLLSRSTHKALTPILVLLHRDLLYHCTIRSDSSTPCLCTITLWSLYDTICY